jgi:hypothetical protein
VKGLSAIWLTRALCLGVLTGLGGSLLGWGVQHHHRLIAVDGALVGVLAAVVMFLNWKLND